VTFLSRFLRRNATVRSADNIAAGPERTQRQVEPSREEVSVVRLRNPVVHHGLAIDVETTGLSGRDEIIEFAGVLFAYDANTGTRLDIVDGYTGRREPSVPISPGAWRVHRISLADLTGCRLDERRIRELLQKSDIVVAHNAGFDRRFVVALIPEASQKPWLCTMNGIAWRSKGVASRRLDDVLGTYHLSRSQPHCATSDAMAVAELLALIDPGTGRPFLAELLAC
jgi:DNA polymerase III subunit epsilon